MSSECMRCIAMTHARRHYSNLLLCFCVIKIQLLNWIKKWVAGSDFLWSSVALRGCGMMKDGWHALYEPPIEGCVMFEGVLRLRSVPLLQVFLRARPACSTLRSERFVFDHAEIGAQAARARPIPLVLPAYERHFSSEIVLEVYMLADVGEYMTGLGKERLDGTRRGAICASVARALWLFCQAGSISRCCNDHRNCAFQISRLWPDKHTFDFYEISRAPLQGTEKDTSFFFCRHCPLQYVPVCAGMFSDLVLFQDRRPLRLRRKSLSTAATSVDKGIHHHTWALPSHHLVPNKALAPNRSCQQRHFDSNVQVALAVANIRPNRPKRPSYMMPDKLLANRSCRHRH